MPKWLFGKKIATLPFWHFFPCALISKILFAKILLIGYYERLVTHFFSNSISGPVQVRPCTYLRGQIELSQVSLIEFQKIFLFWVAGVILNAWDVELGAAIFLVFRLLKKHCVII